MAFWQAFFSKTRASPAAGKRGHSEGTTTRIESKKRHLEVEAVTQKSIIFRVQKQAIIFLVDWTNKIWGAHQKGKNGAHNTTF
jgi:hypothetical protein